jgi:diacylglycerol kinase (ATP)
VVLIVPAGSGNSAYGAIWGEHDWADVLAPAATGPPARRLDLLRLVESDEATFLGVNAGLGGEVARQLQGVPGVDDAKRWEAIGRALADRRPFPGRVSADGSTVYEGLITQVTVGGVQRFMGGGFTFLPRSSLDDGLLDICVITDVDDVAIGELAALMPPGRHLDHPNVVYAQARAMRLERLDGAALDAEHDGDPMTAGRTLTVEVVPGALAVGATAGYSGNGALARRLSD